MLLFRTAAQAEAEPFRAQFRYPLSGMAVALVLASGIAVAAGIGAAGLWRENWIGVVILGWVALWSFMFAVYLYHVLQARLRPGAWLVRIQESGILLNFRSYLNHHFRATDQTVVFIPFSDIEWIREHKIQRTIPAASHGDNETRRQRYVEIKVGDALARQLETRLAQERSLKGPARRRWIVSGYSFSRHYPVQVIDKSIIRIEWAIRPEAVAFIHELRPYAAVQDATSTNVDFIFVQRLTRAEQERKLIELVEGGDRMSAIRAARHLYALDLTEAVRFVDGLAREEKP